MTIAHILLTAVLSSLFTSLLWWIRILNLNDRLDISEDRRLHWMQSYNTCLDQLNCKQEDCFRLEEENQRLRQQIVRIKRFLRTRRPLLP